MKKCITLVLLMMVILSSCVLCFAADPYQNNSNYIYVGDEKNLRLYVNKSSVTVEKYAPPIYEISCKLPIYNKYGNIARLNNMVERLRFNFDTKEIWAYNDVSGVWYAVQGANANTMSDHNKKIFNIVFKLAYNRDFFGGIADERIAIGGISPLTSNADYLRKIYGEPDSKSSNRTEDTMTWSYNQTFSLLVGKKGGIWQVRTEADNGLKTPDGIGVGSSVKAVRDLYGVPYWGMPKDPNNNAYEYRGSHDCVLTFLVKNGIVTSIVAGWNI